MAAESPRVLLVDVAGSARRACAEALACAGFAVECADGAAEALSRLAAGAWDVLVADLVLPDADGTELLSRARGLHPDLQAVAITGIDRAEPAVRALRAGAGDCLPRPVDPEAFRRAVSRAAAAGKILRENAGLRARMEVYEAARRIAAAPDGKPAAEAALQAILSVAPPGPGVLVALSGEEIPRRWEAVHCVGMDGAAAAEAVGALESSGALERAKQAFHSGSSAPLAAGEPPGALVPLGDGAQMAGAVLLPCGLPPGPEARADLEFLARTAAASLSTRRRLESVERLSWIDDLTGLYNGRYLARVLERRTSDPGACFAVLFVDLDRFKAVNDAHGHVAGSRLLAQAAAVLRSCVRDRDVCVRYGGDEFCVVLDEGGAPAALQVAERIRAAMETRRFEVEVGAAVALTASIGVACFPEHARDQAALLELADRAMYRGKASSRNVVYLASELAA